MLGAHRQTVHRWPRGWNGKGEPFEESRARGTQAALGAADLRRIAGELSAVLRCSDTRPVCGPAPRVADLIERECGVRYHPGHVWKISAAVGWTASAGRRALERTNRPSAAGRSIAGRT